MVYGFTEVCLSKFAYSFDYIKQLIFVQIQRDMKTFMSLVFVGGRRWRQLESGIVMGVPIHMLIKCVNNIMISPKSSLSLNSNRAV